MARTQGSPRGGRLPLETTHRQQQTVKEEEGKHRQQDVQQQQLQQARRCGEQQQEMQQQLQQRQETEEGKQQQGMRQDITAAVTADKTLAAAAPVTIAMSSCSSGGMLQPCSPVRGSVVARSASHRRSQGSGTITSKTSSSQSSSASTGNTRSSSIFSGTSEDNRKSSRNLSVRRGNDSSYGSPTDSSSSTRRTPNSSSNSSSSCIREEPDENRSSQNSSDTAVPGSNEETNLSSSHVDGGQTNERSGAKCPANSSSSSPASTRSTGNCDTRGSSSRSSSTHFSVENGSNWVQRLVRENSSSSGAAMGDSTKSHLPMKDCNSSSSDAGVRSTSKNFMGREEESSRGVGGGAATAAGGRRTTVIRPRTDGSTTVIEEAPTTPATTLPPQPRDGWAARMPILRLRVDPTTGDVLLADELPPEQRHASRGASPSPPPCGLLKTGELSSSPLSTGTSTEPPASPEPAEGRSIVSSPGTSACSPRARQSDSSGDRAQSNSQQIGSSRVRFNSSCFSVEGMQRRRQEEEAEEERSAALLRYRLGSELAAAGAAAAALHSGAAPAGSEAYAAASRRAEWERQTDRAASRAAAGSGPAASSSRQVVSLGGESRRARILQHETYTETLHRGGLPTAAAEEGDGETQGFIWGEKVARDGSWRERWIQQVIVEEDSDHAQWRVRPEATQQQGQQQQQQQREAAPGEPQAPLVGATLGARANRADAERPRTRRRRFGQAQGINERRRERWTTRWEETEGLRRVVEKAVQELGEDGEVLQEWVEITEENLMTGECSVTKRGEDYREKNEEFPVRSWVHNTRRGRRRKGRDTAASFSDAAAARGGTSSDACAGDRGAPAAAAKGATETGGAACATAGICRPVSTAAAEEESEKALRPVGMDGLQLQREEEKQRRSTGETDAEEGEAAYEGEEEEELIEETKGGVTRGQRRRREVVSGREEHSVWYRKEAAAAAAGGGEKETAREEEAEIWQDTWIEDPQQGKKWGSKSGVNTRGERWGENWREEREGVREVRRWAAAADGQRQWGEQMRFEPAASSTDDVEETHERWEVEHRDGAYVSFTDRWWLQPQHQNSWGEKKKVCYSALAPACAESRCNSGRGTTTSSSSTTHEGEKQQEQEHGKKTYEEVEETNEIWYDNGKEKVVDEWTTKLLLAKSEAEVPRTCSMQHNDADVTASRRVIQEVKYGRKHTERYEDGMRWGETWHETREPEASPRLSSTSPSAALPSSTGLPSSSSSSPFHPSSSSSSASAAPQQAPSASSWAGRRGAFERQQQRHQEEEQQERVSQSSPRSSLSSLRQVLVQQRRGAGEAVRYEARPAAVLVPPLQLASRSSDVWWREAHGNSWGEKTYTDEQRGAEQREKWYDNGFERQVDRWQVEPDGSSHGEKVGSKADGTEWRERWGKGNPRSASSNAGSSCDRDRAEEASGESRERWSSWFDKSWKERRDGGEGGCGGWWEWGETAGNEGDKRWEQHWWKNAYSDGGGKDFVEKWEDDGHGNSRTVKTGSSWREESLGHRAVTSWFEDAYGEVQQAQEKWAFKRGCNEDGDAWMEKWNNRPWENTAEKEGSNARGDKWREQWREKFDERGEKTETWAEKAGSNAQGDSWYETWQERGCWWKTALKEGRSGSTGEHWVEKWGEDLQQNGAGEKWCQKYACNRNGGSHGSSWGNRWGPGGNGGHAWGEEWTNGDVHKWWHDTAGRPPGC